MIPAVIYAAKSTADPHGSIPTQIDDGRAIVDREGWTLAAEPFVDEAFSAYSGPRGPALADALATAEQLAAEHGQARFVIQHSDRLARGDGRTAPHLVEYVLRARRGNVTIVSKQDPQTFGDGGVVYAALGGDRAHEDSSRKAKAVADGHRRRKTTRRLHHGGPKKYGYRTRLDEYGRPAPGPREVVPAEAAIIRRIFRDLARGISVKQLERDLNAEQIKTHTGGPWYQGVLSRIAHDAWYAGLIDIDGDLVPGEHDPIVDRDLFDHAQAMITTRRHSGDGKGGRTSHKPALFTHGHLRCGRCGGPMGARRKRKVRANGEAYMWERYVCNDRDRHLAECDMPPIPLEDLEAMILDELRARPGQLVDRVREAVEQVFADRDATIARLEEAEREVATLAVQHARLDRDLRVIDDERDRRQLLRILGDIDAEAAAASAQVEQLRARADEHAASAIDDLDSAVTDAMKRIAETISDTDRIETARNVIRQAWPQIVAHYNGATLRVDTGQVSPDFVASLGDLVAVP